jgi:spermidine/putrescine-binding protein
LPSPLPCLLRRLNKCAAAWPQDDSWKELFQPRPEFVGKIGMLKDTGDVITAAALYLGYDPCTSDPHQGQDILTCWRSRSRP